MSKQTSTPIVLSVNEWNVADIKYMQPKLNTVGGKAISMISTKTNRYLHVSTPMMMTWGICYYLLSLLFIIIYYYYYSYIYTSYIYIYLYLYL